MAPARTRSGSSSVKYRVRSPVRLTACQRCRRDVAPLPHDAPGPPTPLNDCVCLKHGPHYAVGALGMILMVTIEYETNEVVTGLGTPDPGSYWSSVRLNRALATAEAQTDTANAGQDLRHGL
ncbi:DUF475 domain-containing protein [Streptomyces coeruleorubidus]|uniref:DUF475 domain-containing protein n=1 Tax=Streptomyces coeruleorubidus TaxID=116188 RepID=UPI00380B51AC